MPKTVSAVEPAELSRLNGYERVIERGLATFREVGEALLIIREERLYQAQGWQTFEAYCRERWQWSRQRAHQLVDAARVLSNLSTIVDKLPTTESQARELASLPVEEQRGAWQEVIELAEEKGLTAATVREVVQARGERNRQEEPRGGKVNRAGDPDAPRGYDGCQTPPSAIDPLLPYLPMEWLIWEPAAGEGQLVEAFYDSSRQVVGSDILTGENFFRWDGPPRWDCLVTNPPFSIKYDWLERCYALGKPFALLLPVETLGAARAQTLFREHGLCVLFLPRRVNFKMPRIGWEGSSAQFPVAWFTWQLSLEAPMVFATADP